MTVGTAARRAGVKIDTIRYYERRRREAGRASRRFPLSRNGRKLLPRQSPPSVRSCCRTRMACHGEKWRRGTSRRAKMPLRTPRSWILRGSKRPHIIASRSAVFRKMATHRAYMAHSDNYFAMPTIL